MSTLLEARNVGKTFGGGLFNKKQTIALQSASLTLSDERPSITAIAGESGSGKTTLARILLGITQPTSGQILYKGQALSKLDGNTWKTFRREVQAVFQDPFEVYNPFYNVDHVLTTPIGKFYPNAGHAETRTMMEDALRAVGLRPEETLGRYPHQLSGGMRQRAMIAMALACRPALLIADEPTTALDVTIQAQILALIVDLQKELGTGLILITHDLGVVAQTAQRVIVMYAGKKVEEASVDDLFADPRHPYTRGLMASMPAVISLGAKTDVRLTEIPGMVPSLTNLPRGCAFAPRCALAIERCREEYPPLQDFGGQHRAACWRAAELAKAS